MIKILSIEKCDGCETCSSNCPVGVLEVKNEKVIIADSNMCTDCGICVEVCPKRVIETGNT